jgi:hypothetical protein
MQDSRKHIHVDSRVLVRAACYVNPHSDSRTHVYVESRTRVIQANAGRAAGEN